MADRAARKSTRSETYSPGDEAESIRHAVSLFWGPAFSASGMSDAMLRWSERAGEQIKTSRRVAEAAASLAQRQGKLAVEFAQSIEMDIASEQTARVPSIKIKTDRLDHLFEEAADIMRETSNLFAETQISAMNLMRPSRLEGKTFSLTPVVESRDAA
ncbi:MAG: hypothetical protein K8R18_07265 [Parvibaculum sp.]|uniref:hypothetical protein n=1 Tax=Parvibaculum sp. TaxID=2024848 RepID=UPI0025F98A20|nr:hypothetical protein [Parvibaculum sp.]MCE9649407.1 hypothetical protein [Parvibaculum sp.]